MTRAGITAFLSYLPDALGKSDIEFKIYTKRLSRLQDDEEMLSADQIAVLNEEFEGFQLRVRAPGDQGNELGDGREIRGGMAHLKAITLADHSGPATQSVGTILTSANLSHRAWSRDSTGFEIGVALEGTPDSRRFYRLFTEALPRAYVTPSDRELATAGGTGTPQTYGTETWLDTRLRTRTVLDHQSVTVRWNDSLPRIESLTGVISVRDTATGDRTRYDLECTRTDAGFAASFPSVAGQSNRIIDFVRLVAATTHAPPELEYTGREIARLRAEEGVEGVDDPLPDEWRPYDEILWNGTVRNLVSAASFGDVADIQSVQLRHTHETPESYYAILEPDAQPHIDQLLQRVETTTEAVAPIGELLRVCIEMHPRVAPDPQDIVFATKRGERAHPIAGTVDSGDNAVYYYFPTDYAGEILEVEVESLMSRFIQHGRTEIELPDVESTAPVALETHFPTDRWRVVPEDIHPVLTQDRYPDTPFLSENEPSPEDHISTQMEATVTPPEALLDAVDEEHLAFVWRPSGVFRSGTIQSLSTPIPKQDVRTRVTYRGIVQLTGEEGPVNVFLPGGDYVVKEQPFVDETSVSLAAVPDKQRLDRINPGTLLGWAAIQRDSLLHPRASDVTECINVRLYVDATPVERAIFDATRDGGVLLVPILGEHIGTTQTLTLRLWVGGGPAKTATYTEAAFDIDLSVRDAGDSLQITVGDQTKQVRDASQTSHVDLTRVIDTFERGEFEGQTRADHPDDAFTIESYDPLHIHPKRMVLLYFTDK